jgi:hypothetical protein
VGPDGLVECDAAVGGNMHDSCCSVTRQEGVACGNNRRLVCLEGEACCPEWRHAVNDVLNRYTWRHVFDPTETVYPNTSIAETIREGTWVTAVPLAGALKAPNGTRILYVDALHGWCASGRYRWPDGFDLTGLVTARCEP